MNVNTINISFAKDLLIQIDQVAKEESRTRSDLLREAARMYLERKKRWKKIFAYTQKSAKDANLTPDDLDEAIRVYRAQKKH